MATYNMDMQFLCLCRIFFQLFQKFFSTSCPVNLYFHFWYWFSHWRYILLQVLHEMWINHILYMHTDTRLQRYNIFYKLYCSVSSNIYKHFRQNILWTWCIVSFSHMCNLMYKQLEGKYLSKKKVSSKGKYNIFVTR